MATTKEQPESIGLMPPPGYYVSRTLGQGWRFFRVLDRDGRPSAVEFKTHDEAVLGARVDASRRARNDLD